MFSLNGRLLTLSFGFAIGVAACSGSDDSPNGGSSGNSGSSGKGSGGASGSSGAGATAGNAGTGNAGAGNSGGDSGSGGGSGGGVSGGGGTGGGAAGSGGGAGTGGGGAGTGGAPPVGDRTPEGTCLRWNADRADRSEGTWSGSVATCDPGDISPEARDNALRLYNLFRWLADLPAVTTDPERNRLAQACALMMEANNSLSHNPPMSWECWSEDGAEGASSSNISSGSSVSSADAYMIDNGNATTIGHRRWILSNSLGPIGIGSTGPGGASCMQNLRGTGDAGKAWTAWPSPGAFPLQAVVMGRGSLDDTGWTVQSDDIDLGDATVTVTSGGMNLPVTVTQLQGGYGSRYAFRFNPDGWETTAGQTYSVSVGNVDEPIAYDVQIVDCGE